MDNIKFKEKIEPEIITKKKRKIYLYIKPIIGSILSIIALIILSPVFLAVAIAIKIEDGGNVFYSQIRVGKNNKPFKMYKFRSMCIDADQKLHELKDLNERDGPVFKIAADPRITKVGKFIRRTCIDELPQFLNIVKAEMAIVGPRPPLPNEVEQYSPHHMKRLGITPGLTCYWQVDKTQATTFDDWVNMDIKYINNVSFLTDLKIIFKTALVVFSNKGDD